VQVDAKKGKQLDLFIRCSDASPQIAFSDFLVRTLTDPGPGGTAMTSYTPIAATDQLLWSDNKFGKAPVTVYTDIRIQDLFAYPDAVGGGTTSYTDNLTFTVVEQ
jgi:hypothetical protein